MSSEGVWSHRTGLQWNALQGSNQFCVLRVQINRIWYKKWFGTHVLQNLKIKIMTDNSTCICLYLRRPWSVSALQVCCRFLGQITGDGKLNLRHDWGLQATGKGTFERFCCYLGPSRRRAFSDLYMFLFFSFFSLVSIFRHWILKSADSRTP